MLRRTTMVGLAAVVLTLVGLRAVAAQDVVDCPENRLVNAGFEEGFTPRGRPEEIVATGWDSWYEALPGLGGINYAPRYAPRRADREGPLDVLSGLWSQAQWTEAATHIGGVLQRVAVPPHSQVLASAYARSWASNGTDPAVSSPAGLYALSLGLDPLGGTDYTASRIVWSATVTDTDRWLPVELDVPLEGPVVTLFLKGQALGQLAESSVRWDDACLRVLGPEGEPTGTFTPRPWPSRTPVPGLPTPSPGAGTREVLAALKLAELLSTATAMAARPPTAAPTSSPGPTAVPTATPLPALAARLADGAARAADAAAGQVGLFFLGGAALLVGLLLGSARRRGGDDEPGRPDV